MKSLLMIVLAVMIVAGSACSSSNKAEVKRKKEAEKMDQLERDKKQFEQKNKDELGK